MRLVAAVICAVTAILAIAGCELAAVLPTAAQTPGIPAGVGAEELGQARLRWAGQGIDSYRLTISYLCECAGGVYELSIVDGAVVKATSEGKLVNRARIDGFPTTIDAIFTQAEAALRRGGSIQATYDPQTGVPLNMSIDPIPNGIDDELGIEIASFVPA